MPEPDLKMEDIPDLGEVSNDEEEEEEPYAGEDVIEEGDQLFTATIPCEAEFICALSNILQHLAEAILNQRRSTNWCPLTSKTSKTSL
jgi:hypothetical protein